MLSVGLLVILLILVHVGINIALPKILANNGIAYKEVSFSYPAEITIKGLAYNQDAIQATIDSLNVTWSWGALLRKKIHAGRVHLFGAEVFQVQGDAPADTSSQRGELPEILLEDVLIRNARYTLNGDQDSIFVDIPLFTGKHITMHNGYHADTLVASKSHVYLSQTNLPDEQEQTTPPSLEAIPAFSVQWLVLEDCAFQYENPKQVHVFEKVHLGIHGLKDTALLNASITDLRLVYQDTIAIDLHAEAINVERKFKSFVDDLQLRIPGLNLDIEGIELRDLQAPDVVVTLRPSTVNLRLVRRFFPDIDIGIKENIDAGLEGIVHLKDSLLILDGCRVQAPGLIRFRAGGHILFEDVPNALDLTFDNLRSTHFQVAEILEIGRIKGLRNMQITGDRIQLEGGFKTFRVGGNLNLGGNPFAVSADIDLEDSDRIDLVINAEIPSMESQTILEETFPVISGKGLASKVHLLLDANSEIAQLNASLKGDELLADSFALATFFGTMEYNSDTTLVFAYSENPAASVFFASGSDIFKDDSLDLHGKIKFDYVNETLPYVGGNLLADFQATIEMGDTILMADVDMDTLFFDPATSDHIYSERGSVSLRRTQSGLLDVEIRVGRKNTIAFVGEEYTFAWFSDTAETRHLPKFQAHASLFVDSALTYRLTGHQALIDVQSLAIFSSGDTLRIDGDVPELIFDSIRLNALTAGVQLSKDRYQGQISVDTLSGLPTTFDSIRMRAKMTDEGIAAIDIASGIPALNEQLFISALLGFEEEGYVIRFNPDTPLLFAGHAWSSDAGRSLFIAPDLDSISGGLSIRDDDAAIAITAEDEHVFAQVQNLQIKPFFAQYLGDTAIAGILALDVSYALKSKALQGGGRVTKLTLDTLSMGDLRFDAAYSQEQLQLQADIQNGIADLQGDITYKDETWSFDLVMHRFDITGIPKFIPQWPKALNVRGKLGADIAGSYDGVLEAGGFVYTPDLEIDYQPYGFYAKSKGDTIRINEDRIRLDAYQIEDRQGQTLTLSGHLGISDEPDLDMRIRTDRYRILDAQAGNPHGVVDVQSDIGIRGEATDYQVAGKVTVLGGSEINGKYTELMSIEEHQDVITFTNFEPGSQDTIAPQRPSRYRISWDVDLEIERTSVYVVLSETTSDYVRMTVAGDLALSPGIGDAPDLFGTVQSLDGRVYYSTPLVPNLNLDIEEASVTWDGPPDNPDILFKGKETTRILPGEISEYRKNDRSRVPVDVLVHIPHQRLSNLELDFDLQSSDADVGNAIAALPKDTRTAYATNLLLFGSVKPGNAGGGLSLMNSLLGKINEMSRKSLRNAELTFYMDNDSEGGTIRGESINKLGYTFSKGLMNNRLRFSVGGNLDFVHADQSTRFEPLDDVEIDYLLRENPDVTIEASHRREYSGPIDGEVTTSSIGVKYQKTFPNLFSRKKKYKED